MLPLLEGDVEIESECYLVVNDVCWFLATENALDCYHFKGLSSLKVLKIEHLKMPKLFGHSLLSLIHIFV